MNDGVVALQQYEIEQVSGAALGVVAGVAALGALGALVLAALDNKYEIGVADAWYKLNS